LHVYDFAQLARQIGVEFELEQVYRQNAGGGWKREQPDRFERLPSLEPSAEDREDAEWWVVVARRKTAGDGSQISDIKSKIATPVAPPARTTRLLVLGEP